MIKTLKFLFSMYHPTAPQSWVYMLQQVDYDVREFLEWIARKPNLLNVMQRKTLQFTKKVQLLLILSYGTFLTGIILSLIMVSQQLDTIGVASILATPWVGLLVLIITVLFGKLWVSSRSDKIVADAAAKISRLQVKKIVVLGSYGKTTTKEILAALIGSSKNVAVTPGNQNVLISHARWILHKVTGQEEVLVFELGEFRRGDISKMLDLIKPDIALITGYAPNHLKTYGREDAIKEDFRAVFTHLASDAIYISEQAAASLEVKSEVIIYSYKEVLGWKITDAKVYLHGTSFVLVKDKERHRLQTKLLGDHLIPSVAAAAVLANSLGVSWTDIERTCQDLTPHPHRMQLRELHGAWIIDDTYNGNINGIEAGLSLLRSLPAKRKIYVTPGLVEQGDKTEEVHRRIGQLIAQSAPDKVVLMHNSVTEIIKNSLEESDFIGEIVVEVNPLQYYQSLEYELAAGDVVLLQNDWTDNYN